MLRLADAWTWDFWLADDGRSYHLYFLKAPRHIGHPDQRHWNASIGHATSPDLAAWTVVSDAITPSDSPAFDDIATWTGSVVRGRDGTWFMFYTGVGPADPAPKQRIGLATSADLHHWSKHFGSPVLESDSRWYEQLPDALQPDEAWRDPWVLADPDGDGWHMLVTARACDGPADQRGVIGHARSDDLIHWQAQPPLSRPGEGFGHLEVPQVEVVGGRPVLVFSCLGAGLSDKRREAGMPGGTWCLPCDSPLGPFDVKRAVRITDESLYSGRLVSDRTGRWTMLAFRNHGLDGRFIGELADPMPIGWATDGSALRLDVAEPMTDALPGRSSLPHNTGGFQMAQIVLNHVEKAYTGGVRAVDDLSLDVKDGEFMVFVGPSGCGKSTALRSIAGLEEITGGTISIGDRIVNDLPPKDRDIAMVFQNYALYPHMTVEQNLAFGLQLRKTSKDEIKRRVDEAAKMLGLEPYLKRKPAALSGGQRQRVAMGRAIVREPQAFLMDEPLSNLDAKLRVSMRASLNQLHERLGVTTVYVTHDQVEAMTLGDRVCVLRDGRLQQVDTPQALFEAPVNLFVAGFIGSPAMNFVSAELVRDDGEAVTFAGYKLPVPADVLKNKPGLADYFGKQVILGIRPSDFEDATLGNTSRGMMRVTAGVTEELGSEIMVIFTIDAPHVEHASLAQAAEVSDDEDEAAAALVGGKSLWTARVSKESRVKNGAPLELAVDTRYLQFFDPASGLSIGHPLAAAGLAEQ